MTAPIALSGALCLVISIATLGAIPRTASALSLSNSVEVLPLLRDVLKGNPGNNELARTATQGFRGNKEMRETQEFANQVRDEVLYDNTYNDERKILRRETNRLKQVRWTLSQRTALEDSTDTDYDDEL